MLVIFLHFKFYKKILIEKLLNQRFDFIFFLVTTKWKSIELLNKNVSNIHSCLYCIMQKVNTIFNLHRSYCCYTTEVT